MNAPCAIKAPCSACRFIAVDVASNAVATPTLTEVITAVLHAHNIVEEQLDAYEKCVKRQSVYCDADLADYGETAKEDNVAALSATAATYEVSHGC